MKVIDLTGQKFGRLTVISRAENVGRNTQWHCRCECGKEMAAGASNMKYGHTASCGCLAIEASARRFVTHGRSRTTEHLIWKCMRARCLNTKNRMYGRYGGRGIKICESWNSFENFFADMGPRPSPELTLERIDNDGNYEPGNCRWATNKEQQNNRTGLRQVVFQGVPMALGKAIEISGSSVGGVLARHRIDVGWSVEEALSRPVKGRVAL